MTDWLAWVDVLEDARDISGPRVRRYVTHGSPFLLLTPFRSAAARYASRDVAEMIAALAAEAAAPRGAEQALPRLSPRRG